MIEYILILYNLRILDFEFRGIENNNILEFIEKMLLLLIGIMVINILIG